LKGGLLIYSLSGFAARPTIDSDYLVEGLDASGPNFNDIIAEIISIKTGNEFIKFEIKDFQLITEQEKYEGTRANLISKIKNTRTHLHLDFGTGDTVIPPVQKLKLPVILSDIQQPELFVYSLETIIAEKAEAIIKRMETTSRMKDFYDIFYLALNNDFAAQDLQNALNNTFENRSTVRDINSIEEINRFIDDKIIISRWENFCEKVLNEEMELEKVINLIIALLNPPYKANFNKDKLTQSWDSDDLRYC